MKSLRKVSHAASGKLPAPVVTGLRSGQLLVGRASSQFRPPPEIVVVGAQRCGTTTLFRLLSDHPEMIRPSFSKGIGYFDLEYRRGMSWYRGHFPVRRPRWLARGRASRTTFESSGYYCFHPLAARRIATDLPDAKVVMLVRNPVERAWSAYKHERARGFEGLEFAAALEREPDRTRGELARIESDPRYRSFEHRHHSYLARGRYAEQVERLYSELGPDRVFVVDADRFFADPVTEFVRLTDRLGLGRAVPESVERWNARPGEMDEDLRRDLEHYYEPYDRELESLVGWTPSWLVETVEPDPAGGDSVKGAG